MGIPFPKGAVFSDTGLSLRDKNNHQIDFQQQPLSYWSDKSIRWLLLDFKISVAAHEQCKYTLERSDLVKASVSKVLISDTGNQLNIENSRLRFKLSRHKFIQIENLFTDKSQHFMNGSEIYLIDANNQKHAAIIDTIKLPEDTPSVRAEIMFSGHFESGNEIDDYFKFEAVLTLYSENTILEMDFTLHNPRAARHKGGFWDLGDPGSLYFKSLILECNLDNIQGVKWKNIETGKIQEISGNRFRIYQDSSGGENWNHRIHSDLKSRSTVNFRGYQLNNDDETVENGHRATPIFHCVDESQRCTFSAYIENFWQNFPKAISYSENTLNFEIFPAPTSGSFELQGGEQKTHKLQLNFSGDIDAFEQMIRPVNVTIPLDRYYHSSVMPGLSETYTPAYLQKVTNQAIEGENNYFYKREKADEYGWRHFGDLWADHETLEHGNNESLISHYNNQYDPIYGFARQYLLTGDIRWFELMNDLVNHVLDIDIYHTELDKPEYNNGLFWHTDHYLDGRQCTHRTFSIEHMQVDHVEQSGGGPGPEHCYTSGIALHYFLTGNQKSKDIILKLGEWAGVANEGTGSLLERVLGFLKKDVKKIRNILKGNFTFRYLFPLTRGTGNYVNSLIDLYLLTDDKNHLSKASNVVKKTLGPCDDIEKRALIDDIESNWHYTIMLQSIIRFMKIKEAENQLDTDYDYAKVTFIHYATWLFKNEKPYLENREKLVYPNDTWVAQDIRKAYILKCLEEYKNPEERKKISERRKFFTSYVVNNILDKRNFTTRILAILLQSYFDETTGNALTYSDHQPSEQINTDQKLTITNVFLSFFQDVLQRISNIKLSREYDWLKFKLKK